MTDATLLHILQHVPAFVIKTDLQGNYTFVNQWFLDFFGFEAGDLLGQSYLKTVHPADQPNTHIVGMKCVSEPGKDHPLVMRKPDKQGNFLWSKWMFRGIKREDGQVHEVVAVGLDVNEEIKNNQILQGQHREATQQSQLLESILATIQDGVVVCSMEGDFWIFNEAAKKYLGVGAIETTPDRWQEDYGIFCPDMKTPFAQEDLPMARGLRGETVRNLELFIRNSSYPDGYYLNSHATPLYDPEGEQIGAVGILHDIDRLKRLNEHLEEEVRRRNQALVESEARYRLIAETSRDMITLHDPEGTYLFVSPAAESIIGYQAKELIGRNPYDFIHPEDHEQLQEEAHTRLKQGQSPLQRQEFRYRHRDGHYVWLESLSNPVLDQDGKTLQIQVTSRDITQRKYLELTLREALDREQEMGELKSQLVSMASHQFRTPLTALKTNLELLQLKTEGSALAEGLARPIERMARQIDRMSELVEGVLTLRRIESRTVKLNLDDCDLGDLVAEQVNHFNAAQSRKISLHLTDEALPLAADRQLLGQALSNLISNAIKYTPPEAQDPEVLLQREGHSAIITFQDHGIGMSERDLGKLFQPFFRGQNALDLPGTGLGLLITKEIIQRHHGSIEVESKNGDGSVFTVTLPLAQTDLTTPV